MKKYILILCMLVIHSSDAQTLLTGMPQPNGSVLAIEKVGNTIYLGGSFTEIDGQPRIGLASFDATSGTVNNWIADINSNYVSSITRVGPKIIVGGTFLSINSQPRIGIAMFDLTTGNLDPWSDTVNYISWRQGVGVYGNDFLYGKATTFGSVKIVSVNSLTGNYNSWQSSHEINGSVNTIYAEGDYVYIGGVFSVTGVSSVFNDLCRFDQITGLLDTTWHPQPAINNFGIRSIVRTSNHIFVGGDFNTISGQSRKGVAGYDLNGNLTNFNQNSSSYEVLSLYPDGNYIWVGGNSYLLGGQTRWRIAQIRISNAAATCWNASATSNTWSTVQAILVSGDTVYTGPLGSPKLSVFIDNPLPQSSGSTISGPATVGTSQTALYSVPYTPGNLYTWTVTGGTGFSISNSINITWGAGTSGTITVVENNPGYTNCYGDTVTLNVTISPGVGFNDNENLNAFSIYPNPAKDFIFIDEKENTTIEIYNSLGRIVLNQLVYSNKIDISSFNSGIYFYKVKTDNDIKCGKFVKQ